MLFNPCSKLESFVDYTSRCHYYFYWQFLWVILHLDLLDSQKQLANFSHYSSQSYIVGESLAKLSGKPENFALGLKIRLDNITYISRCLEDNIVVMLQFVEVAHSVITIAIKTCLLYYFQTIVVQIYNVFL